ncbi:MAG: HU family DNA-binding protein [Candidatus Methylomirabilales bacterium]
MTKAELVQRIAKDAKISKQVAETALDSFMASVRDALRKGKRVSLVGFGTFAVGRRAARNGRNPQTGETIKIRATRVPKFKAGKVLKDAVR